jgi:hypothetical protein
VAAISTEPLKENGGNEMKKFLLALLLGLFLGGTVLSTNVLADTPNPIPAPIGGGGTTSVPGGGH